MLRITKKSLESGAPTLVLEGRLVGPWVELLRANCEPLTTQQLTLDLAEVSYADEAGLALLRRLEEAHHTLICCSPFVREQLKQSADEQPKTFETA